MKRRRSAFTVKSRRIANQRRAVHAAVGERIIGFNAIAFGGQRFIQEFLNRLPCLREQALAKAKHF